MINDQLGGMGLKEMHFAKRNGAEGRHCWMLAVERPANAEAYFEIACFSLI